MIIKKLLLFISLFLNFILFISCKYGSDNLFYTGCSVDERTKNGIKFLPDNPAKNKSNYNVFLLSDIHFKGSETSKQDTLKKLYNYLGSIKNTNDFPAFIIALGDVTDTAGTDEYINYQNFVNHLKNQYNLTTYTALGNHDCYQSGWRKWKDYCYPYTSLYKFETKSFSYYFIDTGTGTIGKNQFAHLKKEFEKDPKAKIILSHCPIYTKNLLLCIEDTFERNEFIALLQENNAKAFLSGHIHQSETIYLGGFYQNTNASFGYDKEFVILNVNEEKQSVSFQIKSLK